MCTYFTYFHRPPLFYFQFTVQDKHRIRLQVYSYPTFWLKRFAVFENPSNQSRLNLKNCTSFGQIISRHCLGLPFTIHCPYSIYKKVKDCWSTVLFKFKLFLCMPFAVKRQCLNFQILNLYLKIFLITRQYIGANRKYSV